MRVSMVSLERRVPHTSEAMVPLERGVVCTLEGRPAPVAWLGVCMAEMEQPGLAAGGRSGDAVAARGVWRR